MRSTGQRVMVHKHYINAMNARANAVRPKIQTRLPIHHTCIFKTAKKLFDQKEAVKTTIKTAHILSLNSILKIFLKHMHRTCAQINFGTYPIMTFL